MENKSNRNIDFDYWRRLAAQDVAEFEENRAHFIEQMIQRSPGGTRQRLRCLQWKLDHVRRLERTPMAACLRMQRMMWDSVYGEAGLVDVLSQLQGRVSHRSLKSAQLFIFRRHEK